MDYGSLLSSFGSADGNKNNTFTWIILIIIILFFGKPGFGFGFGGNIPVTGGMGRCCCSKHHHHSNSCCRRMPNGINPMGLGGIGGYGGNEWLFIILILALVFLLNNNENRTVVEC